MDLFFIKIVAILTMFVDHLGVFVFPDQYLFRLVGRLSFPLFAWAIANGAYHTKNINKYLLRIFILAVVSQLPYWLIFNVSGVTNPGLNILFTFSLALLAVILLNKTRKLLLRLLVVVTVSLLALVLKTDYQAFGVLSVIVFYLLYNKPLFMGIAYFLLTNVFFLFPLCVNKFLGSVFQVSYLNILELFSVVSVFIIALYNNKKGRDIKLLFYTFYPLHLLFLYLFKILVLLRIY